MSGTPPQMLACPCVVSAQDFSQNWSCLPVNGNSGLLLGWSLSSLLRQLCSLGPICVARLCRVPQFPVSLAQETDFPCSYFPEMTSLPLVVCISEEHGFVPMSQPRAPYQSWPHPNDQGNGHRNHVSNGDCDCKRERQEQRPGAVLPPQRLCSHPSTWQRQKTYYILKEENNACLIHILI